MAMNLTCIKCGVEIKAGEKIAVFKSRAVGYTVANNGVICRVCADKKEPLCFT